MEKATRKKSAIALKYATAACAALLGVFVVTNGVCYAATGETWVEKATVYVNGEPQEVQVELAQNGDTTVGTMSYTVEDVDGEGGDVELIASVEGGEDVMEDAEWEITDYTKEGAPTYSSNEGGKLEVLESSDGKVVLSGEGVKPIDITDQLKEQGAAIGEYEKDGKTCIYKVSGEPGNYHVSTELKDK